VQLLQERQPIEIFWAITQEKIDSSSEIRKSGLSFQTISSTYDFPFNYNYIKYRPALTIVSSSDTESQKEDIYKIKEKEWHDLVGKEKFESLDKRLRNFLINAAGLFDLGFPIDIKKAYNYSIFDDEI
jgi:hypothetical protein